MINAEKRRNTPDRKTASYSGAGRNWIPQPDAERGGLFGEYAYATWLESLGLSYEWHPYSEDPNEYCKPDFYHNGGLIEVKRVGAPGNYPKVDKKIKAAKYTVLAYVPFQDEDGTIVWDTDNIELLGFYRLSKSGTRIWHHYEMSEVADLLERR